LAKDVSNDKANIIVVEGIRRPADVAYLKDLPNFILVALETDEKTRFERITNREENPDDIDMLVIHQNLVLDWFQEKSRNNGFPSDIKTLEELSKRLKEVNLIEILHGTEIERAIMEGKFQTYCMNSKYFTSEDYRKRWDLQNEDSEFSKKILLDGLLWNPKTQKYDIPALTKYVFPIAA